MTSSDILDAVAAQSGLPRNIVADMCLNWSRDVYSLYSKRTVRCITLYDLGFINFKGYRCKAIMNYYIEDLEQTFEKYKPDLNLANERVREIVTNKVDIFLNVISQVLQNEYYSYKNIKYGTTSHVRYDYEIVDGYMERFYRVLNAMPCQLKRKEPSEIQKKAVQSLLRSQAYIDLPLYLDCPMWPVRLLYTPKNSLYGLSVSAIILERNKLVEAKRQNGIDSIAKHKPNKKKKNANISGK